MSVLNGTFPLPGSYRRRRDKRTRQEALAGLHELVDEPGVGLAAREGLRCVQERNADPRLMLLIIEAAQEGYFDGDKSERDRQRYAQKKETT